MRYAKVIKTLLCWGFLLGILSCSGDGTAEQAKDLEVEVTGADYNWIFLYPGPDGELHTEDDITIHQEFYLPSRTNISLILTSRDYIYTFSLPDFSANEMAIPGVHNRLSFFTKHTGTFELKGDQMCGFTHESLMGKLKVKSTQSFQNWLMSNNKK